MLKMMRGKRGRAGSVLSGLLLLLVGIAVGATTGILVYQRVILPRSSTELLRDKVTVTEDELNAALGSYRHDGQNVTVTVREAIEETSSLDAVKNDDGTYDVPSADTLLSIARNRILLADAYDRGLEATEEDTMAYAQETLGTQDVAMIAANYNMGGDQALRHLQEAALLKKLKETVVTAEDPVAPEPPVAQVEGAEDVMDPRYAQYIIALAGEEWDAAANQWATDDGAFRTRLRDYTVSNDGATYSAALAAYEEAYARYATSLRKTSSEWTSYVNGLLSQSSIELSTLVA
jgi:hypothetical protein